jgi:CHAD domain-containing protein
MSRAPGHSSLSVSSVHDAALELLNDAIQVLRHGMDDGAVHRARKACKRIRAALRLLRESLGEDFYRRENRMLRDAARPLTEIRDAFVLRQTLRALAPHPATLVDILAKDYQQARSRLERGGAKAALVQLHQILTRLAERQAAVPELFSIAAGVKRSYRAGRKAFEKARSRDDDPLHEWRKQTKYLLNQLDLLKSVFDTNLRKMRHRAHELADALGDDHDLSVLQKKLHRSKGCEPGLMKQMMARRRRLQARSARIGKKLYRHAAKHVQRRTMRKLVARVMAG